MKRRWPALACLGLIGSVPPLAAAPPQPANPAEPLIRNLSHPKYAERERAEFQLRALGSAALDPLKLAADKLDAEGQSRARKLIAAIGADETSRKLLAPPLVRLQFDRAPLADALKVLNAKTGLQFAVADRATLAANPPVTLDTGEVPLWEAVAKFESAAGLTEALAPPTAIGNNGLIYNNNIGRIRAYGGPGIPNGTNPLAIQLVPGTAAPAADLRSAARIRMLPLSSPVCQRSLGNDEMTLGLDLATPQGMGFRSLLGVEITRAQDDAHQLLVPKRTPAPAAPSFGGYYNQFGGQVFFRQAVAVDDFGVPGEGEGLGPHQASFTLNLGKRRSTRLETLAGTVDAVVHLPEEPIFHFGDLAKAADQSRKAGNFNFQIREVKELKKGTWNVRCTYEASSGNPWRGGWDAGDGGDEPNLGGYDFSYNGGLPKFAYLDQNGRPIRRTHHTIMGQSFQPNGNGQSMSTELLLVILTEGDQVPGQLVLSGRRIAAVKVPFEMKNVPLP